MPSADAFFHLRTTHKWIRDLAGVDDVTIYAGLGSTIDRTGLTWENLMDQLLVRFVPDATTRSAIARKYNPVQVATVIDGYYAELSSDEVDPAEAKLAALRHDLRQILYGPNRVMGGRFSQSIGELAVELSLAGKSVAIVTPNYEEYLYLDLIDALDAANLKSSDQIGQTPGRYVATGNDPALPDGWDQPGSISFFYLHGLVSREAEKDQGVPILSESDYGNSGDRSRGILASLFRDRSVIIVGSSLTDAPLVNALIDTKAKDDVLTEDSGPDLSSHPIRVALLPNETRIESMGPGGKLRAWRDQRMAHMGIEGIFPDFYGQAGQLIHEVQLCVKFRDRERMTQPFFARRYGSRLVHWWSDWETDNATDHSRQAQHHEVLARYLARIRAAASIPIDENLKLEAWVRWHPESQRALALWASSTGTWADPFLMRQDSITHDSPYAAVQIFCNGAPRFVYEQPTSNSRWRAYLGIPIWHPSADGRVPVGVISLASMKADGELHPSNIRKLDAALVRMEQAGREIFSADV